MLLRYAAGLKAGSGGLGMGMLGKDMVGEIRLKPLLVWFWLTEMGDMFATKYDLEGCDLVILSS
jgi:hypothetical protein